MKKLTALCSLLLATSCASYTAEESAREQKETTAATIATLQESNAAQAALIKSLKQTIAQQESELEKKTAELEKYRSTWKKTILLWTRRAFTYGTCSAVSFLTGAVIIGALKR
jgi:hypothetical protein